MLSQKRTSIKHEMVEQVRYGVTSTDGIYADVVLDVFHSVPDLEDEEIFEIQVVHGCGLKRLYPPRIA